MPRRRYRRSRRRFRKRRKVSKRRSYVTKRYLARALKSNTEMKSRYHAYTGNMAYSATVGAFGNLGSHFPSQGTGINNRIGDKIKIKRCQFRIYVKYNPASAQTWCNNRIALVWSKLDPTTAGNVYKPYFMEDFRHRKLESKSDFVVLFDRRFRLAHNVAVTIGAGSIVNSNSTSGQMTVAYNTNSGPPTRTFKKLLMRNWGLTLNASNAPADGFLAVYTWCDDSSTYTPNWEIACTTFYTDA